MQLGQTLVKIRKENNLTQEEFAQRFNVTRQTVSNWENEKNYPDLLTLVKISDEFGYSLDAMLKENPNMTENMNNDMKLGQTLSKIYSKMLIIGIIGAAACTAMLVITLINYISGAGGIGGPILWLAALLINVSSITSHSKARKANTKINSDNYFQIADKVYIIDMNKRKLPAFDLFSAEKIHGEKGRAVTTAGERVNVPTTVLYGVTNGLFGAKRTLLGYYASEADCENELSGISEASSRGAAVYELKFAARMNGVRIADESNR